MKKSNNKGFSMVELIITVAILAIMTGSFVSAAGYIKYANAKSGAKKINAELSELRLDTMSKMKTTYLYLYQKNGNTYMKLAYDTSSLDTNATKVGNSQIDVYYTDSSGEHKVDGATIKIEMNRSTGAFQSDVENIRVASADGKTSYTIKLVKSTGKHYIEGED